MRRFISLTLLITYLVVSITGIQLVLPHDKGGKPPAISTSIAAESSAPSSSAKAAEKSTPPFYPKRMHEWAGYLFIVAGLAHLYLNRRPLKNYLQKRL